MRDNERTNKQTVKIELLSQWKLEAEFRNDESSFFARPQFENYKLMKS